MEFNRIVAVTGLPGLYEVLSSKTDGAIMRSLEDKTTRFVSSRIHNISHLESIEVYTVKDNVSLSDILNAMKSGQEKIPDIKDDKAIRSYFQKIYPDLDFERVYSSDLKKMIKWFEVLEQSGVDFSVKAESDSNTEFKEGAPGEVVHAAQTTEKLEETKLENPKRTRKKKTDE